MTEGHRTSTIPRPAATTGSLRRRDMSGSLLDERFRDGDGSGAHRNRSAFFDDGDGDDGHGDDGGDDRSGGLLKDFTSQIPTSKQIVPHRRGRILAGVFATLIAFAIAAALFVLPVKSWFKQRDDLATRTDELQTLNSANAQLQSQVDRLQTDAGIKEAAREEIDYVPNGEYRVTVLPVGAPSTALPDGWPYNLVTSIINLRAAEAVAATAPPTTAAPTVASTAATTVAPPASVTVDPASVAVDPASATTTVPAQP